MKKIKYLIAVFLCLMAPFAGKAQRGPVSFGAGLNVTFTGSNIGISGTQLRCDADVSLGVQSYIYSPGSYYLYNTDLISGIDLSFNHPPYGWGSATHIPIASIDAIPMGGTQTFTDGYCISYIITKNVGYSVVGATYNYVISIQVYTPCM